MISMQSSGLVAAWSVLLSLSSYAVEIAGTVMNGSHGVPLSGVTVTNVSSSTSVQSDAQGEYQIDAEAGDSLLFESDGYHSITQRISTAEGTVDPVLTLADKVTYVCTTADKQGRWQIARTIFDLKTKTSQIAYLTDSEQWNFKPNFSPDGRRIAFFRRYAEGGPCCKTWLSSICVMNSDGSDLREIIAGRDSFNTEPYWTRDGSNRVSFNRMNVPEQGPYWNEADGLPGEETPIGPWGWINPHLSDGRMFMQRGGKSFLATTTGGGQTNYVRVERPDETFIHKIALSRDETLIAYQKWVDKAQDMYRGGVMVYARFDASKPAITDEVIFDSLDPSTMAWYVSISDDNRFLLFAKDGAILQHDIANGTTVKVSAASDPYKAYPTYVTFAK